MCPRSNASPTRITPDEILKVRVDQKIVKKFPFDLIYLVPVGHGGVIPRLFPWSLCFTITPLIQTLLKLIDTVQYAERFPNPGRPHRVVSTNVNRVLQNAQDHFLVIPVMGLEQRRKKHNAPRGNKIPAYITATRHQGKENTNTFEHLFTPDTILFSPKGPVRPICRACPRGMLRLQGKCQLGSAACYTNLVIRPGNITTPAEEEVPSE
jgi:hypothetical protein